MNRKHHRLTRILLGCLTVTALVLSLSGCAKEEEAVESTAGIQVVEAGSAQDSLTAMRYVLSANPHLCAAAFLGYYSGSYGDELVSFLENDTSYAETYPFMTAIPEERFIAAGGDELYCIVPQDENTVITVQEWVVDENTNGSAGQTLYEGTGEPVLIQCNVSDLVSNVVITLTNDSGSAQYSPFLSLENGMLVTPEDETVVIDFSLYADSSEG